MIKTYNNRIIIMADTEFEYGDKRDNLKLIKIDNEDTIAEMVRKINDNFSNIAMHGGGPQGEQGIQGIDGVDGVGYSVILSSPCVYIKCDENWNATEGDETCVQMFYYETDKTADVTVSFDKETPNVFTQSRDNEGSIKITFNPQSSNDNYSFEGSIKKKIGFTVEYGGMKIKCSWTLIPYQSK